MSMMFWASPITSPIGLTVGSTCSVIGTSLTVYFSRVVTDCFSAVAAEVPVVGVIAGAAAGAAGGLAGGGGDDCARPETARAPEISRAARVLDPSLVFLEGIGSLCW
jgi:hypothetical protein